MSGWLDDLKAIGDERLAHAAGLTRVGKFLKPCRRCGAEKRGSSDKRGPLTIGSGGWHCHACDAGGRLIELVALEAIGVEHPTGDQWRDVRRWAEEGGLVVEGARHDAPASPTPTTTHPSALKPWHDAGRLEEPSPAMRERGLSVAGVDVRWSLGHWLVGMYDFEATLVGFKVRAPPGRTPKSRIAKDTHVGVLASESALEVLRGERSGDEFVIIVEGETDLLALAGETDLPLFGVSSGAWNQSLADAMPLADVYVATDNDAAGDKLARQVIASLQGHPGVTVYRTVADPERPGVDWADLTPGARLNAVFLNSELAGLVEPDDPTHLDRVASDWTSLDPDAPIPPRRWLLTHRGRSKVGLLQRSCIAMLNGPTNTGKTWAVYQMAVAVALGGDWLDFEVPEDAAGPVLLYLCESTVDEARQRLGEVCRTLNLTPAQVARVQRDVVVLAMGDRPYRERPLVRTTRFEGFEPSKSLDALATLVRRRDFRLVVVDTFAIACPGVEEQATAGDVVNLLEDLLAKGPAETVCLLVHHTRKSGAGLHESHLGTRGHSSLFSAVKYTLILTPFVELDQIDGRVNAAWVILTGIGNGAARLYPRVLHGADARGLRSVEEDVGREVLQRHWAMFAPRARRR